MLKSYSHDNLRKGRYVEATKRPFFSLLGSRGQALSVSDPSWAWNDADHLELNGCVAQDKHNDQDCGDQDLQAQDRNCDCSDAPQDRRQKLDSRFLNAFPSWNSAPGCRILLLKTRLNETRGDANVAIAEVFCLLLNQFLRDRCRISYHCDGTFQLCLIASQPVVPVEPYTSSARAIR